MPNGNADQKTNGWNKIEKLREWAKLVVVVTALGAISWTVAQRDINDNSKAIDRMDECIRELRAELRRVSACGPDGYVDPEIHSALDTHITHYLRQCFGQRGFRQLQDEYSTIPELQRTVPR